MTRKDPLDTPEHEWIELFIDCETRQLSLSRILLAAIHVIGLLSAAVMVWIGACQWAAGIITGLAATDAGLYFAAQRKKHE